jgi:predicted nucleic acid-binding protein
MPADAHLDFVDTNVLLYAYDRSAGDRHERAATLVGELGARRGGALSVQVLQEFYVTATRKIAKPLDHDTTVARLRTLGRWPLHIPAAHDVVEAAELAVQAQLSFWDAMIVSSARSMGCTNLWSEDLNHGQRIGDVTIRNPFRASSSA